MKFLTDINIEIMQSIKGWLKTKFSKKTKIRLVQEHNKITNETWYRVTINGDHVRDTLTRDKLQALKNYDVVLENQGKSLNVYSIINEATIL